MKKKVGIIKRMSCSLLIFLLSINSFAAIVSDNDGSAFITKAEFDALKSSFQSQIDSYNNSIDSKIDGAKASYLAGIKLSTSEEIENLYAKLFISGDYDSSGNPRDGAFGWKSGTNAVGYAGNAGTYELSMDMWIQNVSILSSSGNYAFKYGDTSNDLFRAADYSKKVPFWGFIANKTSEPKMVKTGKVYVGLQFNGIRSAGIYTTAQYAPIPDVNVSSAMAAANGDFDDWPSGYDVKKARGTGFGWIMTAKGYKTWEDNKSSSARDISICPESTGTCYYETLDPHANVWVGSIKSKNFGNFSDYLSTCGFTLNRAYYVQHGNDDASAEVGVASSVYNNWSAHDTVSYGSDDSGYTNPYINLNTNKNKVAWRDIELVDFSAIDSGNTKVRYGVVACVVTKEGKITFNCTIDGEGYIIFYQSDSGNDSWTSKKVAANKYSAGTHDIKMDAGNPSTAGKRFYVLYIPTTENTKKTLKINSIMLTVEN